ncbi:MAG: GntR family transcriptional regulator, partial [Rhodospirillales bacterium]|nr:GntR family transcriptional regulator [Rhodospirillales bacterium]
MSASLRMPLYHQIYLILRQKLLSGEFAYDDRIPSEQELVEEYEVSRITARRALDELAAEGLVVRQRGRGTRARF